MLIGEISELTGISSRMLRHYDSIGLVCPSTRNQSGYRQYSDDDIQRLFHVESLRALGLGLSEITRALEDLSFDPAAMVESLITRTRERLTQEEQLLRRLEHVQSNKPDDWSDVLRTIGLMRGLATTDASARQRLALSHGSGKQHDTGALIEAALEEKDLNAAGALYWALAQAGDDAVPMLAVELDSSSTVRRFRAIEALEKIDSQDAAEAIAAALHHSDPFIRSRAALHHGARGGTDAIPALLELIMDGRDDVQAADILADLATRHSVTEEILDKIDTLVTTTTAPGQRHRLTQSLAGFNGQQATALLERLSADDDRHVSLTARYLLQQ
jgi:DNA-binding transcriptional MerR regulator